MLRCWHGYSNTIPRSRPSSITMNRTSTFMCCPTPFRALCGTQPDGRMICNPHSTLRGMVAFYCWMTFSMLYDLPRLQYLHETVRTLLKERTREVLYQARPQGLEGSRPLCWWRAAIAIRP